MGLKAHGDSPEFDVRSEEEPDVTFLPFESKALLVHTAPVG
jgi:hypothetical protein